MITTTEISNLLAIVKVDLDNFVKVDLDKFVKVELDNFVKVDLDKFVKVDLDNFVLLISITIFYKKLILLFIIYTKTVHI